MLTYLNNIKLRFNHQNYLQTFISLLDLLTVDSLEKFNIKESWVNQCKKLWHHFQIKTLRLLIYDIFLYYLFLFNIQLNLILEFLRLITLSNLVIICLYPSICKQFGVNRMEKWIWARITRVIKARANYYYEM